MNIGVKVMPKQDVLDTQGRAVEGMLKSHSMALSACRVGKYILLELPEVDPEKAITQARAMAEAVLYNPLIETYELEVL